MSKKKTLEEFISEAKLIHGDKYDYSKVIYVNNNTKVTIICPKHGEFQQAPHSHLRGQKCPLCAKEQIAKNSTLTTEEFIRRAKLIHGDKYDYSKVNYVGEKAKVEIICPKHGSFFQQPNIHLSGHGCPKCGVESRVQKNTFTTEQFIEKAIAVHGDKYDYSKVNYVDYFTKVTIICKTCGNEFLQSPANHLSGHGCPTCGKKSMAKLQTKTTEQFIQDAIKVHGDKYDYSKVNYIDCYTPVTIICPTHGEFEQRPYIHLFGHSCPICGGSLRKTTEQFIQDAKLVHGLKYDYSKVKYVNMVTKICITCPKHGDFWQRPADHINGQGCPHCKMSKGEARVESFLKLYGIKYIYDKECLEFLKPQRPDFYLPDYNLVIEYDGEGHDTPVKWRSSMSDEEAQEHLDYTQSLDELKDQLCYENKVPVLRIKYTEFAFIDEILESYF